MELNNSESPVQKVISWGILGALGMGAIYIFNHYIAPNLIWFFENTLRIVLLGTIPVALALFVYFNWQLCKWTVKTLARKIEAMIIKMDPLSVMDRYIEDAVSKYQNLLNIMNNVTGKLEKLRRVIAKLQSEADKHESLARAAQKQGKEQQAKTYAAQMVSTQNSVKSLLPLQTKFESIIKIMQTRADAYDNFIQTTKLDVENKRIEFEMYSEAADGLKSAEDFLGSDNEQLRLFGLSLKDLEEKTTQKYGYMVEFERRSAPIIEKLSIEKEAAGEEGLRQLEAMLKGELSFAPQERVTVNVQPTKTNKYNF